MAQVRPWSTEFSNEFGPIELFAFPTSSKDPSSMATLGYTKTETLLYDYGDTEVFYVLAKPPEVSSNVLFAVSVGYARTWFGLNGSKGLVIVYNPFFRVT